MPNKIKAFLTIFCCNPSCQTKATAIPINVNKVVQTGANNQFGGLKEGLLTEAYQVSIEEAVAIPPMEPKPTQRRILIISLTAKDGLFIFINL